MRNRKVEINVRVSENEKKKLQRNAKKSGLTLSAYLRKCGLKQEIYAIPDEDYYEIYTVIRKIKNNIYNIELERIEKNLNYVERKFLEIFNTKKAGVSNGNN